MCFTLVYRGERICFDLVQEGENVGAGGASVGQCMRGDRDASAGYSVARYQMVIETTIGHTDD